MVLKWATKLPSFSYKTGYECSKLCDTQSLTPNFACPSSLIYLRLNGRVGKCWFISLITYLDAFNFNKYVSSTALLNMVVLVPSSLG